MKKPCQILLFSGHMIDAPDRWAYRFLPEKEAAACMIAQTLDSLDASPADLAQGSSGGNILFLEG